MDLEEAEGEAAVVEAEVLAEAEDGAGLGHKDPPALQKLVFALIAERLCLISWGCLVFAQGALIVVRR